MESLLLSPAGVAALLGVSRSTLHELLATAAIPSVKIGRSRRIRREDLAAYVEALPAAP